MAHQLTINSRAAIEINCVRRKSDCSNFSQNKIVSFWTTLHNKLPYIIFHGELVLGSKQRPFVLIILQLSVDGLPMHLIFVDITIFNGHYKSIEIKLNVALGKHYQCE